MNKLTELQKRIREQIRINGRQEITGQILSDTLVEMTNVLSTLPVPEESMVPVLYADLVALRDAGQLKAGTFYRITDYVTTTVQANTQSAGHAFDLVVVALDERTVSERAYAIPHEGDTYFSEAGANLSAWQVWYSLDNDSERFAWADAENGKGVIYRLIDEWNNDLPYDFKNILYLKVMSFVYSQWGRQFEFTRNASLDKVIDGVQYYGYSSDATPSAWTNGNCLITDAEPTVSSSLYKEDGSAISYGGSILSVSLETGSYYTFANANDLNGSIYNNVIKPWILNGLKKLNNITFGANCYNNNFGADCYDNNFKDICYNNNFGNDCYSNSFGVNCYNNSFGANCFFNNFGARCHNNSFGFGCSTNSFEGSFYDNIFGNNCSNNSFEDSCYDNTFGNNCSINNFASSYFGNSFGNNCNSNSFGFNCYNNSFGNNCNFNNFGSNCYNNSFGNDCNSNSFGNDCRSNNFGNTCSSNSFQSVTGELVNFVQNISLGDGCTDVILQNNSTASSNQQIQNIRVANGVTGTINVDRNRPARDWVVGLNEDGELTIKALI